MRRMKLRSLQWLAASVLLAHAPYCLAAEGQGTSQPDVSADQLNQFEEVAPPLEEIGGGAKKSTFKEMEGLPGELGDAFKFEEFRPSIEEIRVPNAPAPAAPAPQEVKPSSAGPQELPTESAPKGVLGGPQTSGPLPAVVVDPRAKPASVPAIPPVETALPSPGAPMPVVPATAGAAQSVPLPSRGLSLDDDFSADLKILQERMAQLKERVIETKARLLNYGRKVAKGFAAGTEISIVSLNQLGGDFRAERVVISLDGHQVFARDYDPNNDEELPERLQIYSGSILPGRHRVDLEIYLQGDDGVFDFGYSARMRMEAGEYFTANEGKTIQVGLNLNDQGGTFKEIETRPVVKFDILEKDVF